MAIMGENDRHRRWWIYTLEEPLNRQENRNKSTLKSSVCGSHHNL